MGHSKIGITMDLYSHVIPDMQDELADAVADVLSGSGRHEFCSFGGQMGDRRVKRSPWL